MVNPAQTVYLGLGSNLGDRLQYLIDAKNALAADKAISLLEKSHIYETAPVGPQNQGAYLNACLSIETSYKPLELLQVLQGLEQKAQRKHNEKWGARTLDLDILFWDKIIFDTPTLEIPHPHVHERWFVLAPLSEIAADYIHSFKKQSVAEMLSLCEVGGEITEFIW